MSFGFDSLEMSCESIECKYSWNQGTVKSEIIHGQMQKGRIFKMTKTNRFCIRPKFKRSLFILFLWRYSRTYCRHSNRQVLGTLTRLNMLSALYGWIHAGRSCPSMPRLQTQSKTTYNIHERKCYFWSRPVIRLAAKNREFQDTVFPHIVSAETILFWIWKSKGHST